MERVVAIAAVPRRHTPRPVILGMDAPVQGGQPATSPDRLESVREMYRRQLQTLLLPRSTGD